MITLKATRASMGNIAISVLIAVFGALLLFVAGCIALFVLAFVLGSGLDIDDKGTALQKLFGSAALPAFKAITVGGTLVSIWFAISTYRKRKNQKGPTALFQIGIAASLAFAANSSWAAEKPLAAMRLPLTAKTAATPKVKIVFEGEPTAEVRAWADEAARVVIEWWPQVAHLLATDDFHSPEQLTLTFKKELKGPAHRTIDGLFISVPWITAHPDDFGMIIHEMTHAIQDYHDAPRDAGWLVEGIADYVRYWHYEPEVPRRSINFREASYRDGYATTGKFLAWIIANYDRRAVRTLDAALRTGKYTDAIFEEIAGKKLDPLWSEFIQSIRILHF